MSGPETPDFSVRRFALMPPAKKARKAPDTSAAPEREAQGGEQDSRPHGLQKEAIRGMLAEMCREDRLGTEFFNDEQKQQWQIWLGSGHDALTAYDHKCSGSTLGTVERCPASGQ